MEESADEHEADGENQHNQVSQTAKVRGTLNVTKHTEFGVPTSIISIDEPKESTFRGEEDSMMLLVEQQRSMNLLDPATRAATNSLLERLRLRVEPQKSEEEDPMLEEMKQREVQEKRKKFLPQSSTQLDTSRISSNNDLPTRQEQIKKEPKIPNSILPPTIANQMSKNSLRGSHQVQRRGNADHVKTHTNYYGEHSHKHGAGNESREYNVSR